MHEKGQKLEGEQECVVYRRVGERKLKVQNVICNEYKGSLLKSSTGETRNAKYRVVNSMKICILCLLLWQLGLAVDNCPHVLSLCYLWPGHTKLPEATLDILNILSVKIQLKWYIPMNALGNCEKISRKDSGEDLLVQVHFVPWHNLGCNFSASCNKYLHSIRKTWLFLLDVGT